MRRRVLLAYWRLVPRSRPETCKRCWRRVQPSYTVTDSIWRAADGDRWGVLCLACFGKQMRRRNRHRLTWLDLRGRRACSCVERYARIAPDGQVNHLPDCEEAR